MEKSEQTVDYLAPRTLFEYYPEGGMHVIVSREQLIDEHGTFVDLQTASMSGPDPDKQPDIWDRTLAELIERYGEPTYYEQAPEWGEEKDFLWLIWAIDAKISPK